MTFKITARKILVAAGAFVIVVLGIWLFAQPPAAKVIMPNPNGYDDFLRAASVVRVPDSLSLNNASLADLRQLVAANSNALHCINIGLTKQSMVRISTTQEFITNHINTTLAMRKIAQVMDAAAQIALREARTNDSAVIVMDLIRFSRESARGGLIVERMLGVAIERMAIEDLAPCVQGLDRATAAVTLKQLTELDRNEEPVSAAMSRDLDWTMVQIAHTPWWYRLQVWARLTGGPFASDQNPRVQSALMRLAAVRQALILDAATRLYETEHRALPANGEAIWKSLFPTRPLDSTIRSNSIYWFDRQ